MIFAEFWDIVLSPVFLFTFALVLAPFLPVLWSVWTTWQNEGKVDE